MVKSFEQATTLIEAICRLPDNLTALRRFDIWVKSSGLREAIISHDTAFLYGWLMECYSLQGVSNSNALEYIERHGNAEWQEIKDLMHTGTPACAKLAAFANFRHCGYRKIDRVCNVPELTSTCVVPRLPLRKGDLNQLAFSLFLFIQDVGHGDLVKFIDTTLADARRIPDIGFEAAGRQALMKAFKPIFGIGPKLIAMSLSSILIAGGRHRPHWARVGRSIVVIDSLIHNFMHRTGMIEVLGKPHAFGPTCYVPGQCETILRSIAQRIDLKQIDVRLPSRHARLVQMAVWRFCGQGALAICNGINIDDRKPCELIDCPVGLHCSRLALPPKVQHPRVPSPSSAGVKRGNRRAGRFKAVTANPRMQGDRDSLCGFYTILNGLRLALEKEGGLAPRHERAIWRFLIRYADRRWRFASIYLQGLSTRQLITLAYRGAAKAAELSGKAIVFKPISRTLITECQSQIEAVVATLLKADHVSIVAGFEGRDISHWSIMRGRTAKSMLLLDSEGWQRISFASCALFTRPRQKAKPRYWVKLYGTFAVAKPTPRSAPLASPNVTSELDAGQPVTLGGEP